MRRVGAARSFVITGATGVDLVNASGDVATGMLCPADGAKVVRVSYTVLTTGGEDIAHQLELEHGLAAAGVALTPVIDVANDDAAGVVTSGDGLQPGDQPDTVEGTQIQVKTVEASDIANGLILDVSVLWQL